LLEKRIKLTGTKRKVDDVHDCGNEHSLRSHVGIGSESDCLLGQLERIIEISDLIAGLKVEKWEMLPVVEESEEME